MRGTLKQRRGMKEMKLVRVDVFADLAVHEPTEYAK